LNKHKKVKRYMKENNCYKRLFVVFMAFLLPVLLFAQGWVIDENTNDNSGGFFSGIIGFVLLLGIIWAIGYIFNHFKDRNNHNKRVDHHSPSYKVRESRKSNFTLESSSGEDILHSKVNKQNNNIKELIPQKDTCYVYYRLINGEEYADIIHYTSVFNDGFAVESYAINKDGLDYDKNEYHGVSINNIHQKGIIVAKEEFEKWREIIYDFKLKIEKLIVSNTVPYGNEWKEGDYLYFPVKEILHELNMKLKKENNESDLEGDDCYNGPEFSLLHVTKADMDDPEGFYISISEDYISCENEQSGPKSLKYYISNYNRAHLISKDDYEKARDLIQNQLISFIKDLQSYT